MESQSTRLRGGVRCVRHRAAHLIPPRDKKWEQKIRGSRAWPSWFPISRSPKRRPAIWFGVVVVPLVGVCGCRNAQRFGTEFGLARRVFTRSRSNLLVKVAEQSWPKKSRRQDFGFNFEIFAMGSTTKILDFGQNSNFLPWVVRQKNLICGQIVFFHNGLFQFLLVLCFRLSFCFAHT